MPRGQANGMKQNQQSFSTYIWKLAAGSTPNTRQCFISL